MTPEIEAKHQDRRDAAAIIIIANKENMKVCGVCGSISRKTARICPLCHAYQFDETPEAVLDATAKMIDSPFPTLWGTVPRI